MWMVLTLTGWSTHGLVDKKHWGLGEAELEDVEEVGEVWYVDGGKV